MRNFFLCVTILMLQKRPRHWRSFFFQQFYCSWWFFRILNAHLWAEISTGSLFFLIVPLNTLANWRRFYWWSPVSLPMKLALPVSATPAKFAILSVYYFPVSTTAVRHDISETPVRKAWLLSMTPVRKASPLSLTPAKCVQISVILYRTYFIPNLFYTKFILYQTYFTLNLFNT
jgi:hypothetical protein